MFLPRIGHPTKIKNIKSNGPNELLSMLYCIIRYRDTCIRLHVTLKLYRVLTAQCAVDAILIHCYFLLQALAVVWQ